MQKAAGGQPLAAFFSYCALFPRVQAQQYLVEDR